MFFTEIRDLSVYLKSLNSAKVLLHLGKTALYHLMVILVKGKFCEYHRLN